MGEMMEAMLALSRVSRGEMDLHRIDLSSAAKRICAELAESDPDRHVVVTITDGLTVEGDAGLVDVILNNLLGNAWKFTAQVPQAQIEVGSLDCDGERAIFVRDNGVGFDPTYADKLFSPFSRLHSVAEFPGTGIGLATVQRAVARHGGRCWLEGEVGGGATAHFTLPSERDDT